LIDSHSFSGKALYGAGDDPALQALPATMHSGHQSPLFEANRMGRQSA